MADKKRVAQISGLVAASLGAVVTGAAIGTRAYVKRDRRRVDPFKDERYGSQRGKPLGALASFDGTLLSVSEAGSGPTIVLSHGLSLSTPIWHHQITGLASDARLVMYDQRGHGRSAEPTTDDYSLDALARDLDEVIEDTCKEEQVILLGHSMGGMAILRYAELHPLALGRQVKGIILADTTSADVFGGMLPGAARRVSAFVQMAQTASMRALIGQAERFDRARAKGRSVAYLTTRVMGFGPDPSPAQVNFVEALLAEVPTHVWIRMLPAILGHDVTEALPYMDVPVLVIAGAHDRLTPIEAATRIVEAIPGAELAVVEGAGHSPMLEQPEEFNALVRRFMARVAAAESTA